MPLSIGFVGLGMMGLPMLENLSRVEGIRMLAHDSNPRSRAEIEPWAAWGNTLAWADTLAQLADCEVVITMLPNSTITSAVVQELLATLASGSVIVDMGSSHPLRTRELAANAAKKGIEFVDAPVSGSVAKARTGTLSIMLGGKEAAIERVQPLMERMGEKLIRTGGVGSAHAMKALNNYVYAAGLLAMSEALTVANRMELDLDVFAQVLNASSGRNVATETKLTQFVIPRTFNGGFQLRLQGKDIATASDLAQSAGVQTPQLALCTQLWQQAERALEPGADNTAILRYIEGLSTTP